MKTTRIRAPRRTSISEPATEARTTVPTAPAESAVLREPKPSPIQADEADVRRRAFEIYIERQQRNEPGDALADWTQAERELGTTGAV